MKLDFDYSGVTLLKNWWTQVKANFQTIQDEHNELEEDLSEEVSARKSADSTLQTNINSEATARKSADSTLQSNIDAHAETVGDGSTYGHVKLSDSTNSTDGASGGYAATPYAINLVRLQAVDVSDTLNLETFARKNQDTTLQNNIDAEAEAREAADSTLQSNIDTEAEAREAADAELLERINSIDGAEAIPVEAIVTTQVSNLLVYSDSALSSGTIYYLSSNDSVWAATGAGNDTIVDTDENRWSTYNADGSSVYSIAGGTSYVIKLTSDGKALILAEGDSPVCLQNDGVTYINEDCIDKTALRSNIEAEATKCEAADSKLQSNINTEVSAREAADADLQEQIDAINEVASGETYVHPTYSTTATTTTSAPAFGGTFTAIDTITTDNGHTTAKRTKTVTIPSAVATTSAAGLMSAADKETFDDISENGVKNPNALTLTMNGSGTTYDGSATASKTWYAPTAGGTAGYELVGAGTTSAPIWKQPSYGVCSIARHQRRRKQCLALILNWLPAHI
ncbi:MAG: hypothetical protein LIO59_05055 [Oscillospiraceae bacterium]|nr:hypothetical protein [Oscillospiraceae bacterium]